ncbi:MAG: FG-GAP-like repeat-containing protein, partial [candidate division WOR-3 bacterium]
MKKTVVVFVLAGVTLAGNVTVTDLGVPRLIQTGPHFLPPVHSNFGFRTSNLPLALLGIDSFPSPDTTPFGLAWDGMNLWHVDLRARLIYALDPDSGTVRTSFFAPDEWSKGLCWAGACLWVAGNNASTIYRVDPGSGGVVRQFPAPGSNPVGLAFDGTYLWCADINSNQARPSFIFKLNPANGARLDSFAAPCRMVADMAWDGTRLWVCDMDAGIAYGMNPVTGAVTKATGTPGPMPTGLEFRGTRMVNSDWRTKQIYTFHPDSGPAAIAIDRPGRWDVLPTWYNPAVIGTITGSELDSFRLEYGQGMQPTGWLPAGPTRTLPVYRDTLTVWDLSGISQSGPYSLRVKAFFGSGIDTGHVVVVGIDPQIARGWPKTFANVSPVTCADIAGDGNLELIAGTDHQDFMNNKLAAWSYDGNAMPGFPVAGIGLCQMPAATGNVNRTGPSEIATGFDLNRSDVYLVWGNGTIMNGWPQNGGHPGSLYYHGIPALADIDGDSLLEVFSGGGYLSAWDAAGDALEGWPLPDEFSSPVLVDLDGDRTPELVSLRKDSVYVFKADGSVVSGWPKGFGGTGGTTFPVAGDINADNRAEIVFTIGTRLFCIN